MHPSKVKYFNDGDNHYEVSLIIPDFNGMAIGSVIINNKKSYVVRWNYGLDNENIGFPQSSSHPVWLLLAEGIKLSIDL